MTEWQRCRHWIEAAIPYSPNSWTIEQVEAQIAKRQAQFWPGERSAGVSQVERWPTGEKVAHILFCGGALDELLLMECAFYTWSRTIGAHYVTVDGRPGWRKVLRSRGYEMINGLLTREVR